MAPQNSPWANVGASAGAIGKAAIAWLIITQILSSALGGYLAGRLRTRWVSVHTDEVYFRDTAHGLLVWAVGLVITVYFLASAVASVVGGTAAIERTASGSAISDGTAVSRGAAGGELNAYFLDVLFRSETIGPDRDDTSVRAEAGRIIANSLRQRSVSTDKSYLAKLVAAKKGLSQTDAEKRVSAVIDETRQAADIARKAAAHVTLWMFLALLIGAFCASFAATIGGGQRDRVKII